MTQTTTSRPRIAAIGLSESQIASVSVLCGPMRTASTLSEYLQSYNWTETDLTILVGSRAVTTQVRGNVLAIGVPSFTWTGHNEPSPFNQRDFSEAANTEREVQVSPNCPEFLERLAGELVMQLRRAEAPPSVLQSRGSPEGTVRSLIHTTSGWPVATLGMYSQKPDSDDGWTAIALALPAQANPLDWLRILLELLHQIDKDRVPHPPPRLSKPADWYTPQERELARQLTQIGSEIEHLNAKRERIKAALIAAQEEADAGIRRCIWTDGEELVDAVGHILEGLGFVVRDMDAEKRQGEPKREDLRLTLSESTGWEAMVEVKGYTNGTRTSDARQIREHRDLYIKEQGHPPDLTLWVANPYRSIVDPSGRPAPDNNVGESAANIEAVHVLTTDLFRLWALVQWGHIEQEGALQQLVGATPGLWSPALSDTQDTT